MKPKCGIYRIKCRVTGKSYIGQSVDIKRRWREHRAALNNNGYRRSNPDWQDDWKNYGESSFTFLILKRCPSYSLDRLEYIYAQKYGSYNSKVLKPKPFCFMEYLDVIQNLVFTFILIYCTWKIYNYFF